MKMLEPEDLIKYGLIPEFIGRLPIISTLEDLDEESLVKILAISLSIAFTTTVMASPTCGDDGKKKSKKEKSECKKGEKSCCSKSKEKTSK